MQLDNPMAETNTMTPGPAGFVEKAPLERYVPPSKPSLVGLTRAELADALAADRRAAGPVQNAGPADLALALCARRDPFRPDDQRVEAPARHARRALHPGAAGGRRRAGFGRRHPQVAAAAARRARRRAAARGRMRLHPGDRPRHAVPVEPGRLHADLFVLPYRHPAPGAQPDRGRDRRPGDGRARPPAATGRASSASKAPVCRPKATASSRTSS